jgi:hypothetical protein
MGAPRVRLQNRSRTCQAPELLRYSAHHCTLRCKNAGEGACRAVVDAEIAGRPLHAQRSLAQRIRFPPIRIRTLLGAYPSDSGRHLRAQHGAHRGTSPLEDSVSTTAVRAPALEEGPNVCTPPRSAEFGTWRTQSSGVRGCTCALSTAPTGGLALWRIVSPQLTCGHQELVALSSAHGEHSSLRNLIDCAVTRFLQYDVTLKARFLQYDVTLKAPRK